MKELVSVIIPVYNLEKYLNKSLPSVLNQTYSNLEILLIDDGSKDNTLALCQKYADTDRRIFVLHQENGGVSAARNTGIENAAGDLIAFIDGDDIVAPYYIESLVQAFKGNVLSMCMHERVRDYSFQFQQSADPYGKFPAQECAKRVLGGNFPVCVCGGLLDRRLIGDLRFPVGIKNNEDKYFLYAYLLKNEAGTVAFTNRKMYGYYVREGSATKTAWNGSRDTIIIADQMHQLTMEKHPEWEDISVGNQIAVRLNTLKAIIQSGAPSDESKNEFECIKREILSKHLPDCAGKTTKIEYNTLKIGEPPYRLLVKAYYRLMSDEKRIKRNEHITQQRL